MLDDAVRAAAALATKYLEHRDRVGLVDFGGVLRWLQPGMGSTQRYRLVETLLETGVEPTYTWRDVNIIPARILPPTSLVLGVTPLVDPRFVAALEDLRGSPLRRRGRGGRPGAARPAGPHGGRAAAYRLWLLEREVLRWRLERRASASPRGATRALDTVLEEVRTFRRYARAARV